jgi:hypothetical protein
MRFLRNFVAAVLVVALVAGCVPAAWAASDPANLTSMKYCIDDLYDGFANGSVTVTAPSSLVKSKADCVMYWADSS